MSTRARKVLRVVGVVAGLGLAAGSVAQAQGQRDRVVEREAQRQQQQQQQSAPPPPQAQEQRSGPSGPPPVAQQSPGQRARVVERERQRAYDNRYGRPSAGGYYSRPPVAGSPGYRYDGPRYRNPNYGRAVTVLPHGHRSYNWRGNPYYYYGGNWYGRRGSSYVVVGAPFGLFVDFLPSYYSTVWVGGSRYYYADDTYYTYDAARRGYIVTHSPYDEDDYDDTGSSGDDEPVAELYVYPTRGQSEKQQADDKYECHRWSFDQTGYDPTQMAHEDGKREAYDRALSACLTARGYSVK